MPTYKIIGDEIYSDFTKIAKIDNQALPTALAFFKEDFNRLNEADPDDDLRERFEKLKDALPTEQTCEVDYLLELGDRMAEAKTLKERKRLLYDFETAICNLRNQINYPWDELASLD